VEHDYSEGETKEKHPQHSGRETAGIQQKMIRFHESAQATDMLAFHSACQIRSKVRVRFP